MDQEKMSLQEKILFILEDQKGKSSSYTQKRQSSHPTVVCLFLS